MERWPCRIWEKPQGAHWELCVSPLIMLKEFTRACVTGLFAVEPCCIQNAHTFMLTSSEQVTLEICISEKVIFINSGNSVCIKTFATFSQCALSPQFCHQHSFFTFITTLWLIIVHISKVCILREQYIFSSVWKVNHAVRWGAFDWRVP